MIVFSCQTKHTAIKKIDVIQSQTLLIGPKFRAHSQTAGIMASKQAHKTP